MELFFLQKPLFLAHHHLLVFQMETMLLKPKEIRMPQGGLKRFVGLGHIYRNFGDKLNKCIVSLTSNSYSVVDNMVQQRHTVQYMVKHSPPCRASTYSLVYFLAPAMMSPTTSQKCIINIFQQL